MITIIEDDLFLEPCNYCTHLKGEYCNFFNDFINEGIDFKKVPWDCRLPDFTFDGEVLKW
ncbi:MAG: hypothetical protein M0P91_09720 [Sulfuricurvum sp.]|jgi:hypothetical protein|uniref:hypothetical protein n=1 Tax=Sulfuricurvum sp. TaxID=2025608 RepID=UPI0025CCD0B5|nr:hypothetical protein [Sulfuricurvum sp.]MCK9373466.1 hypothetical protein [Sulfuricurvum sp.]